MDINKSLNQFIEGQGKSKGRKPDERYASFDFCYNYFYSFYKRNKLSELANEKNIQMSCLQLAFYLASWGMMRGSSFLFEKSGRHYMNLINTISKMETKLWEIDVDDYNEENIDLLLKCKREIIKALKDGEKKPSDTLITKIMMGVFANTPAFDQYVRKRLEVYSFNRKSLLKIKAFYEENKKDFDSFKKIPTFDFLTSKETKINYTKAKLIDMYAFTDGQK